MDDFKVKWEGDVKLVRPKAAERAKQDIDALFGVNGVSTASQHLSMLVTAIAPGEKSNVHYHVDHESALFGIGGSVHMFWGAELEHDLVLGEGDFCYIPAFCPHVSYNRSHTEPATFVTARTDALEQERVVPLPELDDDRCRSRVTYVD